MLILLKPDAASATCWEVVARMGGPANGWDVSERMGAIDQGWNIGPSPAANGWNIGPMGSPAAIGPRRGGPIGGPVASGNGHWEVVGWEVVAHMGGPMGWGGGPVASGNGWEVVARMGGPIGGPVASANGWEVVGWEVVARMGGPIGGPVASANGWEVVARMGGPTAACCRCSGASCITALWLTSQGVRPLAASLLYASPVANG